MAELAMQVQQGQPPAYTTQSGGIDYEALQRTLQENVNRVRQVQGTGNLSLVQDAAGQGSQGPSWKTSGGMGPPSGQEGGRSRSGDTYTPGESSADKRYQTFAGGVSADAAQEVQTLRQQANAAATAMEIEGAARIQELKHYDTLLGSVQTQRLNMKQYWDDAMVSADEAVEGSRSRMSQIMGTLDRNIDSAMLNWDSATTHALQTQVVGGLSEMRAEEMALRGQYGAESPEMQQFKERKMVSMHMGISKIHSEQTQMRSQLASTLAMSRAETGVGMSQMVNYAEKDRTAARIARAEGALYDLQGAEMEMQIEQMRTSGLSAYADLFDSIGAFQFDSLPWINLLMDAHTEAAASIEDSGKHLTLSYGGG